MNVLKEACIISHERWINNIENEIKNNNIEIPDIKIPNTKKDNIIKINNVKDTKKRNINKNKLIKIIFIAAVLLAALLSVCAFSPFKSFVVEFFDDYNLFINNTYEMHYPNEIEITNLSKGFILVDERFEKLFIMKEYRYNEKSFIILKNTPDTYFQISNTYPEEIIFYNNDIKYMLLNLTDDCTEVVWLTDEYSYVLTGYNMTNEEIMEIAKNIK